MADLTAKTPTPALSPIPASVPVGPMDAPGTEGGAAPASGFEDDEQQGYPVDGLPAQPPGPPPQSGWVYDPSRGWLSPEVAKEVGFVPSVPTAPETSDLPGTESLPTGTVIGDPSAETVTMVTDTGKKVDIHQSTFRGIAEATNPESQLLLMKQAGVLGAEAEILPGGRYIPSQVAKKVAGQSVELERWERDVLPTMPEEYQDAYRSGDTAKVERLAARYQADYDKWASQFTPKELEQLLTGQYQVLDFDTNQFVAVPKKVYEEREQQYQQYPEAGTSPGKARLPKAIEDQRVRYETQVAALNRLQSAGFVDKLPEGRPYMKSADTPPLKEYTIPAMAEFARKNPDGMKILRDAGFDDKVLADVSEWNKATGQVARYLDKGVQPTGAGLSRGLGLSSGEISALGRALDNLNIKPVSGSYVEAYRQLNDDQKRAVAVLFDKDWTKGNAFSALAADIEHISGKGLVAQLLTAPIQPITTPIGKQLTLPEAKAQLSRDYAPVLSALKDYVKADGTFDIKKYEQAVKSNPNIATQARIATGYTDTDAVKNSMEYYNYATQVTPKEWVTAGLVGVLDVMMLGGGGALASLGVGGRIAGQALSFGTPVALGVLQAPDVVRMISSPAYGTGEKIVAGLGEAAMFFPLAGMAIRGTQFLRTISRPDYVPARSLIVEASTPRAVFSPNQIAKLSKAGAMQADFIQLSSEIEKAMTAGKKSVTVNFKGIPVRVKNVTYQVATGGGARFTGVPDISLFTRGEGTPIPLIKEFYNSYKTALEPIRRSYNEGQLATKPGIVEVRISDSTLAETLMAQRRGGWKTAKGGYELELEGVMPSLNELRGRGYDLVPIPGKAGRGVTFDAELGLIEIRRFTLAKVVDNPTGLIRVKVGGKGDGGVVGVGDLHATTKFQSVFDDINSSFADPIIKGNPSKPSTWSWNPSTSKGRTVVVLGDSIDRGTAYNTWRTTLNRLSEEAARVGDKVERVLGNHELAYLSGDNIKGTPITPDKVRASIRRGIIEDIQAGRVKAAVGADGKLFTHAGVSKGVFPELSASRLEAMNKYLKSAGDLMRKACNI